MKRITISLIHVALVALTFLVLLEVRTSITMWILILNYYQYRPEFIPYQIVPLDAEIDCRLEMGIELIYPQSIMSIPEPQKEETLQIIYQRVAFEISNTRSLLDYFK